MINLNNYSPIQAPGHPGFYICTLEPEFASNVLGDILNIHTGVLAKVHHDKRGYLINYLNMVKGKGKHSKNHRLVASAFYGLPPVDKPFINHLDGIRDNNYFKNLEWCSQHENTKHAYVTGLNKGAIKPMLVWDTCMDVDRQHIQRYESINDCSDAIGVSNITISSSLTYEVKKPLCHKRWIFKFVDDVKPFPDLTDVLEYSQCRPVFAYNLYTGENVSSKSNVELAKKLNTKKSVIWAALKREVPCVYSTWLISNNKDEDWETLAARYFNRHRTIVCHDIVKNVKLLDHSNATEIARIIGINPENIHRALHNKTYKFKNYIFYYFGDSSETLKKLLAAC